MEETNVNVLVSDNEKSDIINYVIHSNDEGYIDSCWAVLDDTYNYTGQLADFPDITEGWYKFVNNEFVIDEEKKAEIIAEKEKEIEIIHLEKNLNDTDYIMASAFEEVMSLNNPITFISDFIKILVNYRSKYAEQLANRKAWRERIEELKGTQ